MDMRLVCDRLEIMLKGRSIDGYEIMAGNSRNLSVEVKEGKVDTFKCSAPVGVSVRVLKGEGLGFSYSTSMEDGDLSRMIDSAIVGAETQTPDRFNGFVAPQAYPEISDMFDDSLAEVPEGEKIARAMELERLVLAEDPRVKRVRKASYGESIYSVFIRNSLGVEGGYSGTSVSNSVSAVAEEGSESQMGWDFGFSVFYNKVDVAAVARLAARKAVGLLGAEKIPTMRCPVVLDNYVATEILEVLAPAFLAENVQKGKSLLAGRLGESLFAPALRIRDDGTLHGGSASTPFDGEGAPQSNTVLVENGALLAYLYDGYCARKDSVASTGNSVRGGVKGQPHMGVTNFFIENGSISATDLFQGIGRGMLITEVMGMHTANPISGEFSVGAAGFLIENGVVSRPVKGVAIAGSILDLFRGVEAVGNDLRFFGSIGSPSLRIAALDISGY